MATRTPKAKTPKAPAPTAASTPAAREEVSLRVCIDELQLISDLSDESPQDSRIKQLCDDAQRDILAALIAIRNHADDLPPLEDPVKR